jgi:GntR family transcriptional regulator
VREVRYREIAADLRRRIAAGEFDDRLLPSEATLSGAYEASRVTIRRALDALKDEGLVASRQGMGWSVDPALVRQALGRLTTVEAQLAASGREAERRILGFAFLHRAPAAVAEALGPGTVLEVRRVNLADGEPFARVTVWCPERYASGLSRDDVEAASFHDLLPVALAGARQSIGAVAAGGDDAELLGVPTGSPLLRCWRVTWAAEGEPVLLSESVFPAGRTEFVVDLPGAETSIAPTGLRLVE